MLVKILAFCFIFAGFVIMAISTLKYYKFCRDSDQEQYSSLIIFSKEARIALFTLCFFLAGFLIGMIDVVVSDVPPIFAFVGFMFLVGAVFIAYLIRVQGLQAENLRQKNMDIASTFINAVELKDTYTRGHSHHVHDLVGLLYDHLPSHLSDNLNRAKLLDAALLHDIGKISVPDGILGKSGKLTDSEWEKIRRHPADGKRMLDDTCFTEISDWVLYHHERMDGRGYEKLSGDQIPLESRIIAVADTFSALTTDRIYKKRISHEKALMVMRGIAGTQLDANIVEYFETIPMEALDSVGTLGKR